MRDLHEAVELYRGATSANPSALVIEYSRAQILSIVNAVVPQKVLLDAQVELARAYLEGESRELRRQRNRDDNEWNIEKQRRRAEEIARRVAEQWRGPY